jgi:Rrf2 family protein
VIPRAGAYALRALLAMAEAPERWRSVADLAAEQGLPAPMLEQLLLRLRRAGLLEARRGRHGGYRLSRSAAAIPVGAVLAAVATGGGGEPHNAPAAATVSEPAARVVVVLEQRLQAAVRRELAQISLEELRFDLVSTRAGGSEAGGVMLG